MPEQFPIKFEFQSNQQFNTFYPGNNKEIIFHLQQIHINKEQQTYLWGKPGTGKTHLLQATVQAANNLSYTSFYFSFDSTKLPDPSILNGLENLDIVCLDNIDKIAGDKQ